MSGPLLDPAALEVGTEVGTEVGAGAAVTSLPWRERLRAWRWAIVLGVVVVVVTLLLALAQSGRTRGLLDPAATDPAGSAALAAILTDQGVTVVRVTTAEAAREAVAAAGPATLLVAPTAPLSPRMLAVTESADADRLVLVAPSTGTLDELAPGVRETGVRTETDEVAPDCRLSLAERAGPLPATGALYGTDRPDAEVCWGGALVDVRGEVAVLGAVTALTNDELARSGNAALGTGLLGAHPTLVWWLPSLADPAQSVDDQVDVSDLVPPWVSWALAQLAVVVAVVAWWRGRRLGRVVLEPLPVVVRATETVEGRARLYRRADARDRAAAALRAATTERLRTRLALPRGAAPAVVADAAARRTGRQAAEVAALLAPAAVPPDDAALVALRTALDTLENEVRRS